MAPPAAPRGSARDSVHRAWSGAARYRHRNAAATNPGLRATHSLAQIWWRRGAVDGTAIDGTATRESCWQASSFTHSMPPASRAISADRWNSPESVTWTSILMRVPTTPQSERTKGLGLRRWRDAVPTSSQSPRASLMPRDTTPLWVWSCTCAMVRAPPSGSSSA